ncbi:hypothetical protein D9V37_14535 [Nocardioides mangrovicus]|uniref:SRPBCC family protein n=1 Tax=Nocardioides mangrovicus TaxID=2478913 RepID=A0A3L8P0Y1_9ACTN|nr:SRPBCC family protein [Nocardioides mangrovicus]RLV48577.1 hypothetical protein D9V37_14535 [Nocardioides mangrovicus]
MTWFEASNHSTAVVPATREDVWAVLVDPQLLPRLTPFLTRIDVDGDHWRWEMTRIPVLSTSFEPSFTEQMTFTDRERIEWKHDPPAGRRERAGVAGWYALADADGGTRLEIQLSVRADLPLPRVAKPAVTTAMKSVIAGMGKKFGDNLLHHLRGSR